MSPILVTAGQREKALRIYAAALPLIAEAIGLSPKTLHNRVLREALFDALPYPKPAAPSPLQAAEIDVSPHVEQLSPAETSSVGEGTLHKSDHPEGAENEVETAPVMKSGLKPLALEPNGKVSLGNGREWLHWSCTMLTPKRNERWTGTVAQAKACLVKFDAAKNLKMTAVPIFKEMSR